MDRVTHRVNRTVLRKSNQLVTALRARGMRVDRAYLYGSHAKGYAHRDSDIDIAIISRDLSGDWLDDFVNLTRIADDIDARMEVVSFLPHEFRDDNPFVSEIKTTGIPLVGNGNRRTPLKRSISRVAKHS